MAITFWNQSGSQSSQILEFGGLWVLVKSYPEPDKPKKQQQQQQQQQKTAR